MIVRLLDVPKHRPALTARLLRRWTSEHKVPYYKVGGVVMLDLDELDAYVRSHRVDAVPTLSNRRRRAS